jgi:hypothetical protein
MVYAPLRGKFQVRNQTREPCFQAKINAEKMKIHFYPLGERDAHCDVDLASFLDEHFLRTAERTSRDGKLVFTSTTASGESKVIATFLPEAEMPLETIRVLTTNEKPITAFAVTVISVNQPVPNRLLFPPDEVEYADLYDEDAPKTPWSEWLHEYVRAYKARAALVDPEAKDSDFLKGVDWDVVEERDQQIKPRLMKLFDVQTN